MTLMTMVWALKEAPVPKDPIAHLVLIGLADHAHDDGSEARPSVATLAQYARCSPRTVHNKLRLLEDEGLITRGDQRTVAHIRADRRPVVYNLIMRRGVHEVQMVEPVDKPLNDVHETHTVNVNGVNSQVSRGEQPGSNGVNVCADRTTLELLERRGGQEPPAEPVDNSHTPPFEELGGKTPQRTRLDRCERHQVDEIPPPCGQCKEARIQQEHIAKVNAATRAVTQAARDQGPRCTSHNWRPAGMCMDCAGEHKGGDHRYAPSESCHLCDPAVAR